jgi:hypothetical protein
MFIRCPKHPKPLEAAACAEPPASGTESEDEGDEALERVQEMLPQPVEILQAEKSGWATDWGSLQAAMVTTAATTTVATRSTRNGNPLLLFS